MGLAENRAKSQAFAQWMKEHGIRRTTAACPWHCGAQVKVGGPALLIHLNTCKGGGVKRRKA